MCGWNWNFGQDRYQQLTLSLCGEFVWSLVSAWPYS
jgi:hypothetical protein